MKKKTIDAGTVDDVTWREAWRVAIAPHLETEHLRLLLAALRRNDRRLIQGETITPIAWDRGETYPATGACVVCYGPWRAGEFRDTGDGEAWFERWCQRIDSTTGHEPLRRLFINWYDSTPRAEVFRALAKEVGLALYQREQQSEGGSHAPSKPPLP